MTFADGRGNSLTDYVAMEGELGELLARPVDIVDRRAIEQSENWLRRRRILASARTVYAA